MVINAWFHITSLHPKTYQDIHPPKARQSEESIQAIDVRTRAPRSPSTVGPSGPSVFWSQNPSRLYFKKYLIATVRLRLLYQMDFEQENFNISHLRPFF